MIGTTVGHYQILEKLGEGGMGEVYRATDTKRGRDVALKVLPADLARDAERLARFQREARAVAALNHPHIVTLYSVEEAEPSTGSGQGGIHFLTMELVEGQSLDRLIPQGGLSIDRVLVLATAPADALVAAHEKSIVHRDLKPANVMVAVDGRVKVLDFGLAKVSSDDAPGDAPAATMLQTREGVVMGTVPYMSPEQVAGRAVDHRTDIFSLGVILYEMASGWRPFEGASSMELASAILRDTPLLITDVRGDLPADLARLIRRCLDKDPRQRIQTAREVMMEGSLRQAGSTRVSAQLVDATTGAHLWAETFDRPFRAEDIFAVQDDVVPRIVSSVADAHGVLPHTMSERLRSRSPDQLSPYEAVLRSFGYGAGAVLPEGTHRHDEAPPDVRRDRCRD